MSQKKNRERNREKRAEIAASSKQKYSREELYKKNFLAKFYDKINPGDYTIRQDFYHTLFLFSFLVIVVILIGVIWIGNGINHDKMHESRLVIPASSFVQGQEQTVTNMLDGYGFQDIQKDADGNIIGFGTQDMVDAYKASYKEKTVDAVLELLPNDRTDLGIESISFDDDGQVLTINTYRNLVQDLDTFKKIAEDDDISRIISVLSSWCGMEGDGTMTTRFVNVFDTTNGTSGTQYYESDKSLPDQMLADLEQEQEKQEQEKADSENGTDEQKDESAKTKSNTEQSPDGKGKTEEATDAEDKS